MQAAFRYPGFDVVYEGMMSSSIDDGGLEFRGTEATIKLDRSRLRCLSRGPAGRPKSNSQRRQLSRRNHLTTCRISSSASRPRKEPNAPVETGISAARAGHIANLAYKHTGQITWPPKG